MFYRKEKNTISPQSFQSPKIKIETTSLPKPKVLETYVFDDTRTVELMDRFEGIGTGSPYDQMIIKRAFFVFIGSRYESVSLVLERSRNHNYEGDITFTQFKKGEYYELKKYVITQLESADIELAKKNNELIPFSHPYLLRAQNSRNRTGYGWEWDWTDRYDPLVTEGTLYGETTNYVFVGVYIG